MTLSHQAERLDQLRDALARIEMTEAAEERPPLDLRGENLRRGPGGMLDPPDRTAVAGLERAVLHVVRVNEQTGGVGEHLAGERELIGARLPRGRHTPVENAVREQTSGNAGVALHGSEIAVAVLPADRQPCDEVVEDEVVEDHHARPSFQSVDDPAVCFRIIADVVERNVGRNGPRASASHEDDLHELAQRGQKQHRVVGYPGPFWRQRRVIGNPHASRRAIVSSQDTRRAISFPARPHARASSTWSRSQEHASASAAARGSITSPVARSVTTLSGPPASVVVTTGFSARNAA